jgi:hypothetical protein
MRGQKRPEIRFGNTDQAIDSVRNEKLLFDPAPGRGVEASTQSAISLIV